MSISEAELNTFREQLKCGFKDLDEVFGDCMEEALACLSERGVKEYVEGASLV